MRKNFKSTYIIIYENDSIDSTKQILRSWNEKSKHIYISLNTLNETPIKPYNLNGFNKYFSSYRINKMANYRNKYLEKIEELDLNLDFVIILDLDVDKIEISGILNSFELQNQWDVVSANGHSLNRLFQKRYHDSYALVELGNQNVVQTEKSIKDAQKKVLF